ncbi:MAG: hypothetical protein L6R42_010444, partial [Xanthoria sp. 1 TBL-2021]
MKSVRENRNSVEAPHHIISIETIKQSPAQVSPNIYNCILQSNPLPYHCNIKNMSSPAQNQATVMPKQKAKPTKRSVLTKLRSILRHRLILGRSLLDEIVEIKVGPSNRIFKIHKGLLCDRASYFKAVYQTSGDWKEKYEGLTLKTVNPNTFQRFVLWLYFSNILDNFETVQSVPGIELINCYLFADERDIPEMHNQVIDTILERIKATKIIFVKHQRFIWENTPDRAPLRRLL